MSLSQTIHPVIGPVPLAEQQLKMRAKVEALRRLARLALQRSAQFSGFQMGVLKQAENGAPLPSNGIHWSLSHKNIYVAAVASWTPVGIDIEQIAPYSEGVARRLAGPSEWALAPEPDIKLFYRYWTAKEAVLKAVGAGLAGLGRCRVEAIPDDFHLRLSFEGRPWTVTHHWIGSDHLVAVTSDAVAIEWHVIR
ncbi:MAG: 4'-phosphopantetheinyl transferase superfamily protein [Desulfobacteraceae bacterium]|nr:4'-phosphopantetheinyl transferase superfamily protein [Desulfobacteraceae bacterium]